MPRKTAQRLYWGTKHPNLPQLDLLEIQKQSYYWFLKEGISQRLEEISPIQDFTGKNWELVFSEHKFGQPKHSPIECSNKGVNYDMPLKGKAILKNKQTGKITEQEVFLGDIPQMTENGTFIINGIERAVVNQLVRSPGIFFQGAIDQATGRMLYNAEVRPMRGSWLEFSIGRNDVTTVRIDRRRKFPATVFLRSLGISQDKEIISLFQETDKDPKHHYIESTIQKDPTKTKEEALIEIYRKIRPGEPAILENAENLLNNMFFSPRRYDLSKIGRFKINKRLNLYIPNTPQNWILNQQDVVALLKYLINLQNGHGKVDDIDHLANRRVRRVGELVSSIAFRAGLLRLERAIKEKMSLVSTDELVTPSNLINARPVIAAINEFFRSNQLSTILDQTNPLSELDNLRRLSVMGQGGISRERASFSIRDINSSQYGRICPVRSPEGPNIGLVTYMTLFSRVNEFGFLEVPYRKIIKPKKGSQRPKVSDEIVYLSADDEEEYFITHATINIDKKGFIVDDWVPVRHQGEFLDAPASEVDLIDIVPQQIIGTAASLIPFISHDEANRALMGTHMQCQAVPLIKPKTPIIGTDMEKIVPEAMKRIVHARHNGKVVYVDSEKVILKLDRGAEELTDTETIKTKGNEETYLVTKFKRTNPGSTCYSQRPVINVGNKVKKGELLIDGPASDYGELALGQNLLIAYLPFEGLGHEDAIIISDRLFKEDLLTSITIEGYEAAVVDTKLGPEELTRDIPNVSEQDLANLAEDGIVVIGSEVGPNDILVGKIAPKGETELTAEERLLRAIFGEKAREVRDTSLRMSHGERGTVIDIRILDKEKGDELEPGTNKKVIVKVAQMRKVTVGDKLAGRHGNKGVISKIVPVADMPYLSDGTSIDIIISPLSVLARMNLGQLLEAHLGWAAQKLGYRLAIPSFEEIPEGKIIKELKKSGLPISGKTELFDGRTGEKFDQEVVVGIGYIMKLIHMVEDKTHARSTGPYSLVTQQPLGGKAQMGGQRLGEMEVWALEAHRAAHTLQEMLTIKSDDVVGRAKAFEAIVKGTEIPESTVPESFKVLVKELNSLCLNIIPQGVREIKEGEQKKEAETPDLTKEPSLDTN
jgi:DNA-directed RNA polymerase subunit beta